MTVTANECQAPASRPKIATTFRVVAIAEAFSWLALLIAMYFKYGPAQNEIGVKIFGPIHGGIFIAYVIAAVLCWWLLRWGFGTAVLALIAAVPPFFTLFFEMWALRTGRLDCPDRED